jgi:hypothetical protein
MPSLAKTAPDAAAFSVYDFNADAVDAAADRVKSAGAWIVNGRRRSRKPRCTTLAFAPC